MLKQHIIKYLVETNNGVLYKIGLTQLSVILQQLVNVSYIGETGVSHTATGKKILYSMDRCERQH